MQRCVVGLAALPSWPLASACSPGRSVLGFVLMRRVPASYFQDLAPCSAGVEGPLWLRECIDMLHMFMNFRVLRPLLLSELRCAGQKLSSRMACIYLMLTSMTVEWEYAAAAAMKRHNVHHKIVSYSMRGTF